jgi:hypothetical protein
MMKSLANCMNPEIPETMNFKFVGDVYILTEIQISYDNFKKLEKYDNV